MGRTIEIILIGVLASLAGLWINERLVFNLTHSYPVGVYSLSKSDLFGREGELVWFDDISGIAKQRGYIPRDAKLMKEIVATPGTSYCVGSELRVGDRSYGSVYKTDSTGLPLPDHRGCHIVPNGHVLTASDSFKSYDSRYFGPVPAGVIHGKLEALWIW